MRKIPFAGIELTSQRVRGYMVPLSYRGEIIQNLYCTFYYLPKLLFLYVSMVLLSTVGLYSYLCITVVMLGYDWWLCMVINISVQYSGGLLPDIILLTQGYYQWGTRLNTM